MPPVIENIEKYDYELVVMGDPKPQGRPRTRVVQATIYLRDLFASLRFRIGIAEKQDVGVKTAFEQIIEVSSHVDIQNWPAKQHEAQVVAQEALGGMEAPDWTHELKQIGAAEKKSQQKAFAQIYEDKSDKENKASIKDQVKAQAPKELLDGPLRVDICFFFKRPKSHYRTGKYAGMLKPEHCATNSYQINKCDRDNLDKAVLDALTGVFWKDDARVCQGWLQKQYSERPRTEIFIKILNEERGLLK